MFAYRIAIFGLLSLSSVFAFHEDSIFENEDIYGQLAPSPPSDSSLTFPGTKWCGPGNTAANYDDLGTQSETDKCCRAHDHCPVIIESNKYFNQLHNPDWFPRLTCDCEQALLNCLQRVNTAASNTIGRIYFTARTSCFKQAEPVVECTEFQKGTINHRCIRYKFHKNKPKKWQFFDIPFYTQPKKV